MFIATILLAATQVLPQPMWGEPTLQRTYEKTGLDAFNLATGFVSDTNTASVTMCGWIKFRQYNLAGAFIMIPMVMMNCSNKAARSTTEGGAPLSNLTHGSYWGGVECVPLSASGTWSDTCLPSTYDYPDSTLSSWQYGCYCFNISTDTPLTLNVGGEELYIPATNHMIRNVKAISASRAVSIAAENANATVQFGIAENPLIQFIGADNSSTDPHNSQTITDDTWGGVTTNHYRFFVMRAAITNGQMNVNVRAYDRTSQLHNEENVTKDLWHPTEKFEKDARFRMMVGSAAGLTQKDDHSNGSTFYTYGIRMYGQWLTDEMLETMRDQDWAELVRRGLETN